MTAPWKTVRVFICSTFKDMQAERDYLVRFVFPRLRERLIKYRIHLVDIDLRWGVTSEQDTVEVCRNVIDDCYPRFLCMLGGRYGWVPPGGDRSITAEEVQYGVFDRVRENRGFTFFYFRDDSATAAMEESVPGVFREPPGSDNLRKLIDLKDSIVSAGLDPFTYSAQWDGQSGRLTGFHEFGERVFKNLLYSIESDPKLREHLNVDTEALPNPFFEANAAMDAFTDEHSRRFVIGSRRPVLDELLKHAKSSDGEGYACLTGPSGSGKSALLAYLSLHGSLNDASVILIKHFVGVSPGSTDIIKTLHRLCHELKTGCPEITGDIPNEIEKLRFAFADFLHQTGLHRHVVILLDAVDQFEQSFHFIGLNWLPGELPKNVRIILSILDGPVLEDLCRRPHRPREIRLEPLTFDDGESIIEQFSRRYHKSFEPEQIELLLGRDESGRLRKSDSDKPLFLLAALEELRTLGTYSEINRRIAEMPATTFELFKWVLSRLENDDGFRDAKGKRIAKNLVSRFTALLGASRYGLSQRELITLLAPGDAEADPPFEPDAQGNVAALLHLLRPYMMYRGELLDFYHRSFRDAAAGTGLKTNAQQQVTHKKLAHHFRNQADPNNDHSRIGVSIRALSELPFHQFHARLFRELTDTLCTKRFIDAVCTHLGREAMLDNLEFGLAAARQQQSIQSAVAILLTWGEVLTSQQPKIQSLITRLFDMGNVKQALHIALNELPPIEGIRVLTQLSHKALDNGMISLAEDVLGALLALNSASPKGNVREQLKLIDRLARAGSRKALQFLLTQQPEESAVRILLFMIGASSFSEDIAYSLRELLAGLNDPHWRGVCQCMLCLRAMRRRLPLVREIACDLAESLKDCHENDSCLELEVLVARCFRWLQVAGLKPTDIPHVDPSRFPAHWADRSGSSNIAGSATSSGSFRFVPSTDLHPACQSAPNWKETAHQALYSLVKNTHSNSSTQLCLGKTSRTLPTTSDESSGEWGHPIFWISQLPSPRRPGVWKTYLDDLGFRQLPYGQRIEVIYGLWLMGETAVAQSLLTDWASTAIERGNLLELLEVLNELPPLPFSSALVDSLDTRFRAALNSPHREVCMALVRLNLHHDKAAHAVYWLDRLCNRVAPPADLSARPKQDLRTLSTYLLLSTACPPRPESDDPKTLLISAREHAEHIIEHDEVITRTISEEFGRLTAPLGHLADRILVCWVENLAASMPDTNEALLHLRGILKLGMVNDDRERLRSWFLWLLAFSNDPDTGQITCWKEGVQKARAQELKHEEALLRVLDSMDEPNVASIHPVFDVMNGPSGFSDARVQQPYHTPPHILKKQDVNGKLETFSEFAEVVHRQLIHVAPHTLGKWCDAALRCFDDRQDQARAFAYLAEASSRLELPELTQDYLDLVTVLETDLLPFAKVRAALGRLSVDGTPASLRQWPDPYSISEAFKLVLERLAGTRQSQDLLELTSYLRRAPKMWSNLTVALCSAINDYDDAQVVYDTVLDRLLANPLSTSNGDMTCRKNRN